MKLHRFFDAVHGLCELPAEIVPYIEHPYFVRLKNIAQLGTLKFVHRQATHTRYEHSLGVAYLAYKAAQALGATTREQFLVSLAGAYHDIGHGAFSHSFDSLIRRIQRADEKKSYAAHEIRSLKIFEQVANDINEQYAKNNPYKLLPEEIELVKFFIDPSFYIGHITQAKKKGRRAQTAAIQLSMDNIPEYTAGIDQIVNNHVCHLDVDKMDYIMRDSIALNLPEDQRTTSEDILQMLARSAVLDHYWTFDAVDEILVSKLVLTRSLLFANYYVSPKVAAVDLHMLDILQRIDQKISLVESAKFETTIDIEKYIKLTDTYIVDQVLNNTDLVDVSESFIQLLSGKTYKYVCSTTMPDADHVAQQHTILTDKSSPLNMLPLIKYHKDKQPSSQQTAVYRLFRSYL